MASIDYGYKNGADRVMDRVSEVFRKTYAWMCGGLFISALVAYIFANVPALATFAVGNLWVPLVIFIACIGIIIYMGKNLTSMKYETASILFIVYSAIMGMTLSTVFLVYKLSSIASVFLITGGVFGAFAAFGYLTKKDLSGWGNILFMGLIGLIIATVVGFFIMNDVYALIVNCLGVIIFVGLIAYDNQNMKKMARDYTGISTGNIAIWCALGLYLDFINLFLRLLELLGKKN